MQTIIGWFIIICGFIGIFTIGFFAGLIIMFIGYLISRG